MVIDESMSFVTGGVARRSFPTSDSSSPGVRPTAGPSLDWTTRRAPPAAVTLSQSNGHTEMTVHVELPASFSEHEVRELFAMGVRRAGATGRPPRGEYRA